MGFTVKMKAQDRGEIYVRVQFAHEREATTIIFNPLKGLVSCHCIECKYKRTRWQNIRVKGTHPCPYIQALRLRLIEQVKMEAVA